MNTTVPQSEHFNFSLLDCSNVHIITSNNQLSHNNQPINVTGYYRIVKMYV